MHYFGSKIPTLKSFSREKYKLQFLNLKPTVTTHFHFSKKMMPINVQKSFFKFQKAVRFFVPKMHSFFKDLLKKFGVIFFFQKKPYYMWSMHILF